MEIEVKEVLSKNNITQQEFSDYLGITRVALNKSLNHSKQKRGLINNLKMFIAEKRGLKINVEL
jgi:predicted XRE-type DNA-binding protein